MKTYIAIALATLLTSVCAAQTFSYSDNHVKNPIDVSVIGQVKNNIIVWCEQRKDFKKSAILVYDKQMHLIRKETTDVLHSDASPMQKFYCSGDSFYIAYQYRKGNDWEYRLAGFDSKGKLSSSYTLDRLQDGDMNDQLFYNFCQSNDKKTLCCIKTILSPKYNALNFKFTFLSQGSLYHDSLFISFDKTHERMIDFLVDDHKNVSLLKTSNTDTGFILTVVKKDFSADHYLTASKKLALGDLKNGTPEFYHHQNEFTVSGVWENAAAYKNANYKTGVYSWKLDEELADKAGSDVILPSDSATIFQINHYAVNNLNNTTDDFFGVQTDSTPIAPPEGWNAGTYTWQGMSGSGGGMSTGSLGGGGGFFAYIPSRDDRDLQDSSHYKAGLGILRLNNNQVKWYTELNPNADKALLTDLVNNKVVAGKQGLHVVRFAPVKKNHYGIEHALITYAGKYEKINTPLWNDSYVYLIPYAEPTDDGSLIIPCTRGTKVSFAKMNLE